MSSATALIKRIQEAYKNRKAGEAMGYALTWREIGLLLPVLIEYSQQSNTYGE